MTVVGIVSDTHLARFGTALPRELVRGLRAARVSRILHCGDYTEELAVPLFEAIAPLDGVAGNNDPPALRARFGERKILAIDGVRIGIVHGHAGRHAAHENAVAEFAGDAVDVVLYGHSHRPVLDRVGAGRLVANPGSPTDKRAQPRYSYALLTIDGGRPQLELRYFDDRRT